MPQLQDKKPKPSKLKTALPVGREVIYPAYDVVLYCTDEDKQFHPPMTADDAKEILGWTLQPKDRNSYLLLDRYGERISCYHNLHNRPFNSGLAHDWMLEILNGNWRLNGETIILDKYGDVQDGQHRLIGLIWAVQEWEKDHKKPDDERRWKHWDSEPTIETLVFCGIEADDATVNTIGVGKPRTLEDALARCSWFAALPESSRLTVAKAARYAVKFLQYRTAQESRDTAKRSHSEAFAFIERHSKILDCVKFIHEENDGNKISSLVPLGYAAGMLYLMAASATDDEQYRAINNESCVDWSRWDEAQEFWVKLANVHTALEPLADCLDEDFVKVAGGKFGLDLKTGLCLKAWNLYSEGQKVTKSKIAMEQDEQDGVLILTENPSCGGIDIVFSGE